VAESRSINYEYENKQGLDSEQKGTAGQQVTGKYETMDHNGKVIEVKYIADHMGFRIVDEPEVTDKDINSPNAEPEIEPTKLMTQTAEETTNEPFDSSVRLTEQEIEPTTNNTLEIEENEGEGEEEEGEETEAEETEETEAEEVEDEETEDEETEDDESETEETEDDEMETEDTEAEETEVEGEAGNEEENTEASITEEEIKSESMGKELNHTKSEIESEAEVVQPEEEENEPMEEGKSMNIEAEMENNNIVISKRKGEESPVDLNYQLREILQVPTSDFSFNILPSLPQPLQLVEVVNRNSNGLEIEQEVLAKSFNSRSGSSVQSINLKDIPNELYSQVTEILQLPKLDTSFVYYDNQSPFESNLRIREIDQEIKATPKRMVTISSKQLNNVNPGTVVIENTLVSKHQISPEVVIVRMEKSGVLSIEAQKIKKEIPNDQFNRRSSMKIESELIDEKDFSQQIEKEIPDETFNRRSSMKIETELINEEPNIVVREIFSSSGTVQSQLVEESQAINAIIEEEPLVVLLDSPVASKIILEVPSITIEESIAENMPRMSVEQEMVIETEVIDNLPLPIALIQPQNTKTRFLKKISDIKATKQFVRSAPKPTPVLLQQRTSSVHSLGKGPLVLQRISQEPTPKEIKTVEVRGAPKPISVIQVNPDTQVKLLENEQIIYDNKNTKITAEVVTEDVTSGEIKSFKIRDFVRF